MSAGQVGETAAFVNQMLDSPGPSWAAHREHGYGFGMGQRVLQVPNWLGEKRLDRNKRLTDFYICSDWRKEAWGATEMASRRGRTEENVAVFTAPPESVNGSVPGWAEQPYGCWWP